MQRLIDTGLTILLVATLAAPASATPQARAPQANTQPTNAQTTETVNVKDAKVQAARVSAEPTADRLLSERDRLILERRLQRVIPQEQ
ncbi:hypothetical protein JOY44_27480 (plasmid) [Phormidium sp. CLA17]|uniref:hypothetical protein n=1 Tax=Leptolyngbya sp. Cla-17 TaxID=2803751 RepID=UPI00149121EC|nr:hypothetical protein [Leptolyngbya sp. Cla-17]MBM0745219.1 hypothetical protein [Leptolyngbya sp. Cla-17]